jgi:hypothetical protein
MFVVVTDSPAWISGELSPRARIYDSTSGISSQVSEVWAARGTILEIEDEQFARFSHHCVPCQKPTPPKARAAASEAEAPSASPNVPDVPRVVARGRRKF